jgi:hypothetical protein
MCHGVGPEAASLVPKGLRERLLLTFDVIPVSRLYSPTHRATGQVPIRPTCIHLEFKSAWRDKTNSLALEAIWNIALRAEVGDFNRGYPDTDSALLARPNPDPEEETSVANAAESLLEQAT